MSFISCTETNVSLETNEDILVNTDYIVKIVRHKNVQYTTLHLAGEQTKTILVRDKPAQLKEQIDTA